MRIEVTVDGKEEEWVVTPNEFLAETLRRYGYTSVKTSCDGGACGSCTVFLNDASILSCEYLTIRADGQSITTLKGVAEEAAKVADCLVQLGAEGCGWCAPGFVMQVIAMKRELKNPTYDEVKAYLNGNLCRCTGYVTRNEAAMAYMAVK
jgi:aerobic carbon-monoxide dehydrogenase small subunit